MKIINTDAFVSFLRKKVKKKKRKGRKIKVFKKETTEGIDSK